MCASANGRPRIRSGCGQTVRLRWTSPPRWSEWSKLDRALVVSFALAEVLVQGGERVGIPEIMRPTANRNVIEKMAQAIMHDTGKRRVCRRSSRRRRFPRCVVVRLLVTDRRVAPDRRQLAANGAHGHVVQVVDPAEESFPIRRSNRVHRTGRAGSVTAGRAETWRNDYQRLVADHRGHCGPRCEQSAGALRVHRTEPSAADRTLARAACRAWAPVRRRPIVAARHARRTRESAA